jgi:hypothetical protein
MSTSDYTYIYDRFPSNLNTVSRPPTVSVTDQNDALGLGHKRGFHVSNAYVEIMVGNGLVVSLSKFCYLTLRSRET